MIQPQPTLTVVPDVDTGAQRVGELVGSYRLEKVLGEGAMGVVYLGRHTRLDRPVALKFLHPQHLRDRTLVQRFLQEAKTVNQINHHHIVEIHDFVEELLPQRVYCVMELLQGQTLAERLAAGPVRLSQALRICRQIAEALGAAHQVGVIHRDVKPDNVILIKRDGQAEYVKVLDFGVAKLVETLGQASTLDTLTGTVVGTPRYMAPEQAAGLEVDHRADVYSLGTMLYELIAGRPPFEAETFGQLSADIITRAPPPLPARSASDELVTTRLARLVDACLSKRPSDRPATMLELMGRLDIARESSAPLGVPVAPRSGRRSPLPLAAAVLGVGLAIFGGLAMWLRAAPPAPVEAAAPVAPPVATPAAAPAPAPAAPPTVSVSVVTRPPGAAVIRADTGATLGVTPFSVEVDRAPGTTELRLELSGHAPEIRPLQLDANVALDVTLTPLKRKPRKAVVQDGVLDPFAE